MGKLLQKLYHFSGAALLREYQRTRNQKNIIFIWIPKTAGTSLVKAMDLTKAKNLHLLRYRFVNRGMVTFGHMDYAALVEKGLVSRKFDTDAFKFAFSRNPYDRAVSLFSFFKKQGKLNQTESFLSFWQRMLDDGYHDIGLYNVRKFSQCNPQVRWIKGVQIDFLGAFETLETDVARLMDRLNLSNQCLPHLNPSAHGEYRRYYNSESQEIIRKLYSEDFLYFGYDDQNL